MKAGTEVWLIVAIALVLIGCILFVVVMTTLKWDFKKLATVRYETNSYEVTEAFDGISVNTDTADLVFELSQDGKCRVECHEEETAKHSVTVENGTLTITLSDERTVYHFHGLIFDTPKITVYLPNTEYTSLLIQESTGDIQVPKELYFRDADLSLSTGDVSFNASVSDGLKIKTSTGDICVESLSAGALDLTVSTGKVTVSKVTCQGDVTVTVSTGKTALTDLQCGSLITKGSTGSVSLRNVVATGRFSIQRSTGAVRLDGSDAAEISIKTDTGNVTGTLLTDKVFIAQTDTGKVDVPRSVTGGRCEITTSTGNIQILIQ